MTLVLPSSYSEYWTENPASSRSFPAMRAQSRSWPGGLTVSKRSSARVSATASKSIRQRVRADLHLVDLRRVLRAALVVEHGARARHGPQALALPAGFRIVDAAIH